MADAVATEGKLPPNEHTGKTTLYRVVRWEYENGEYQEEPGGITDAEQRRTGQRIIKTGSSSDIDSLNARALRMDLVHFPEYPDQGLDFYLEHGIPIPAEVEDNPALLLPPDDYAPQVGEIEYSYHLESLVGGKWKYVRSIHPYRPEHPEKPKE
jgi:hypothetical protein